MSEAFKEWIKGTPLYQAMVNVGYFPVWSGKDDDEWRIVYWSIRDVPLPLRIRQLNERSNNPRVIQEPYEDCDLHKALMNTGYTMCRKRYYVNGNYTGKVVDYYAPAIDYTSQKNESRYATRRRLHKMDRSLGTDFAGDYKRDCRGFGAGW